jgi:hypothetical protein
MPPTIIARNADNWVDRGEPAEPRLALTLAHLFSRRGEAHQSWLIAHGATILGMVAAGATDYHVNGYIRSVARELDPVGDVPPGTRMAAVALWHIAKAALVRDFAERVLSGDVPPNIATPAPLGEWLASKLLNADEMAQLEAERDVDERNE